MFASSQSLIAVQCALKEMLLVNIGGEGRGESTLLNSFRWVYDSVLQVKGISGSSYGMVGILINIDEGDGIVKLDADAALKIISLDQLAKYVSRH